MSQRVVQECCACLDPFSHTRHRHTPSDTEHVSRGELWQFYRRGCRWRLHRPRGKSCSCPAVCASFCSIPATAEGNLSTAVVWIRDGVNPHIRLLTVRVPLTKVSSERHMGSSTKLQFRFSADADALLMQSPSWGRDLIITIFNLSRLKLWNVVHLDLSAVDLPSVEHIHYASYTVYTVSVTVWVRNSLCSHVFNKEQRDWIMPD